MTVDIQFKRGTKAKVDSLASKGQLKEAEPIFITDQNQLVIANSSSTYVSAGGGDISSLLLPDGATKIGVTPTGNLTSTTVQAALAELDSEISAISTGTGTVTSVGVSVPTGMTSSGSPITTSGTISIGLATGYSIPTTASQTNWDAAYSERLQWDGGSTNLVVSTARTSLGLGSLATQSTVAVSQLPAGASTGNTFVWDSSTSTWVIGGNLYTGISNIKNAAGTTIVSTTDNSIKVVGGGGTTVTGSGNTLTISSASGTVTSVAMTVPTGLSVSGSPISTSGTLAVSLASGYSIPTTASQANWDAAYTDRNKWDGGAAGLVAATGRTSLGLGSLATKNSVALSDLPAGTTNGNVFMWNGSAWVIGGNINNAIVDIKNAAGTTIASGASNSLKIVGASGTTVTGSGDTVTISKLKVAIIGDSLSQSNIIRTSHWIDILKENISKFTEDISVLDLAIGGYTFYKANTDLAFSFNSSTGQYTKTMVQECIDNAPDIVIVMLGMNDIAQSPSRTLAQMQSDASTLFNALNAGLPNSKIVYVSEIFYDNINFDPSVANSVKNKAVIPAKFTLNSSGALANAYSSEILENTISSATQTTLNNWKSLDAYIRGLTSYIDRSFRYYHWRAARLGLFLHDGLHQNDLGSRYLANNIFIELVNAGLADSSFYNLFPTLVSKARAVFGTKTLDSATVLKGTIDPTGVDVTDDLFHQIMNPSGTGYVVDYTNDNYRYLKDILGPFRRVDPDSWYMPTKGRYLINNKSSTSADSITLTLDNSSTCLISFFSTTPNTLVYKTLDNSTYSSTSIYTDSNGDCSITLKGIDFGATGSYTFRFKINNEVYGPVSFTVNAAAVTPVSAGGTGASSLTSAGIVTTTDAQTISGAKTFSSYSNSFTGVHYTSTGSASNAFLSESSSYAVVGGANGVVLATGSTLAGATSGAVLEGSTFRPASDNSKTLGTSSYRWSTIYAVNGTINTSDYREKQNIVELSDAEKRVAKAIKSLVRRFEFKADPSKLHIGVVAQEVISAFNKEGLNAFDYAIIDYQEWKSEFNEKGEEVVKGGNRYGVNYSQLLAFIISSI